METKLNLNDDLPLKKAQELYNMVLVVKYVFYENDKY